MLWLKEEVWQNFILKKAFHVLKSGVLQTEAHKRFLSFKKSFYVCACSYRCKKKLFLELKRIYSLYTNQTSFKIKKTNSLSAT
jgi:hypothetical protein